MIIYDVMLNLRRHKMTETAYNYKVKTVKNGNEVLDMCPQMNGFNNFKCLTSFLESCDECKRANANKLHEVR